MLSRIEKPVTELDMVMELVDGDSAGNFKEVAIAVHKLINL